MRVRAGPAARLRPFGTERSARISGDSEGCSGWPPADDSAHARAGTWQFYNLRAGSPRGAAFSGWWKAAGPRAGQRHASVLGTVPRNEGKGTALSAESDRGAERRG